jgi:uncharacterized OB-fold protein
VRSIVAAALHRPVWESGRVRVEGPDEDAFTLVVAALETLEFRPGAGASESPKASADWTRLHVVGEGAPESGPGLSDALGSPRLEIRRHAEGPAGLWAGLREATDNRRGGAAEVVVAADVARIPKWGAAAVAFLITDGAGLEVLVAPESPNGRATHARGPSPEAAPPRPESETIRSAVGLQRRATQLPPGQETRLEVPEEAGLSSWVLRNVGWVDWIGAWTAASEGLPLDPGRARRLSEPVAMDRVSEGAYLPRPRYIENLPNRWRLVSERCARCGARTFPSRGACRACGARDGLRPEPLASREGTVEAITTVRSGAQPTEFDPQVERFGAYDVAIVRLAPDIRATFQVTDAPPGALRVGDPVRTALRRLYPQEGEWRYGRKAVPAPRTRAAPVTPAS